MSFEETDKRIQENNAALLLVGHGKDAKQIDPVAAGVLLGKITSHHMGLGTSQYTIPVEALEKAGVRMDYWEKAKQNGAIREAVIDGKKNYIMPHEFAVGEHVFVNPLVHYLQDISGMKHSDAVEKAKQFSSKSGRSI